MVAIEIVGSVSEILRMLEEAKFGERHVIVYPDLDGFNKICGQYTKKHLERDNEIVVLLPFYQTVDSVTVNLHRQYNIDVRKYGEQGSLLIMDSYKTYTGFREDRELLFRRILSHAAMSSKNGISILMDMGVFSFIQEIEMIAVNFRDFLSSQQELNIKAFFSYHKKDYDKLSEEKKSIRFSNNYTSFIVG